ncbi:MAG: SDR family NAD(P)-dependent oxidoreductase [Polyangiaceae bacterium]|nr:SDR family NAD(P)-dependent oxidoreductase [Polyangiaceae bacterium]
MGTNGKQKRVAVITGARRGLGLATAEALAKLGLHVVITARGEGRAEVIAAAGRLAAEGLSVEGRMLDVTNDDSVSELFGSLRVEHGRLDVLVNNAGAIFEASLGERAFAPEGALSVPAGLLATAFDTNTLGAYRTMQQALPLMNAVGYGRVVNVSSGMGGLTEMNGGWPAYRTSKAALNALTRVFHAVASPGVKVNAVCPGWVRTEMGGPRAPRSLEEGIAGIVWAATLPDDGPSGGFFRDGKPIPW